MTDLTKTTSGEASILKKYFTTDGRATRPEYWAMIIITSVVTALALMLLAIEAVVVDVDVNRNPLATLPSVG